jgi:hypothetical protein
MLRSPPEPWHLVRPSVSAPQDFSVEWRSRCERFRAVNRRWLIAAFAWLLVCAGLFAVAWAGLMDESLYLIGGVLFFVGMPVFMLASQMEKKLLLCPNCGSHPRRAGLTTYRNPERIEVCEACFAKLG